MLLYSNVVFDCRQAKLFHDLPWKNVVRDWPRCEVVPGSSFFGSPTITLNVRNNMIDLNVQSGEFLPDILMLTQAPIVVWFDDIIIVKYYYLFNYVMSLCVCVCVAFCFCCVWWPGMATSVSKCTVYRWVSPRYYTVDPRFFPFKCP